MKIPRVRIAFRYFPQQYRFRLILSLFDLKRRWIQKMLKGLTIALILGFGILLAIPMFLNGMVFACDEPIPITTGTGVIGAIGETTIITLTTGDVAEDCGPAGPGGGVIAFQAEISYNTNVVSITTNDVIFGDLIEGWSTLVNDPEPGVILINGFNIDPLVGEGVLFEMIWTRVGEGETVLETSFIYNEGNPTVDVTNGYIYVTDDIESNVPEISIPPIPRLMPNFPNPFNPKTIIPFSIPKTHFVELTIYDINGRPVRSLLKETRTAGTYNIQWNGMNETNKLCPSGVYFYQLKIDHNPLDVQKMLLLR